MTRIRVAAETSVYTAREPDPNDEWDAGDTSGQVDNVWACPEADYLPGYHGEMRIKEFRREIPIGTTLYAVVADYESGSTFGRIGGCAQIVDVFLTKAEADNLARKAQEDKGYSFEYEGETYHRSWVGYFETLQSIDVWEIVLREGPQSFLTPAYERTQAIRHWVQA